MNEFHNNRLELIPILESNYANGDVLFEPIEIGNRASGIVEMTTRNNISIRRIGLTWDVSDAPPITLYFFEAEPTTFGDINTSPGISQAELRTRIATITVPQANYTSLNSKNFIDITGDNFAPLQTMDITDPIWIAAITNDAYTSDLEDNLFIQIDIGMTHQ